MATKNDSDSECPWEKGARGENRAAHLLRGFNSWYIQTSDIGDGAALLHGPDGGTLILPDYLMLPDLEFFEVKNYEYARSWYDDDGSTDERVYVKKRHIEDYVTIAENLAPVKIGIYLESSHRLLMADVTTLSEQKRDESQIHGETVCWYSVDDFRVGL